MIQRNLVFTAFLGLAFFSASSNAQRRDDGRIPPRHDRLDRVLVEKAGDLNSAIQFKSSRLSMQNKQLLLSLLDQALSIANHDGRHRDDGRFPPPSRHIASNRVFFEGDYLAFSRSGTRLIATNERTGRQIDLSSNGAITQEPLALVHQGQLYIFCVGTNDALYYRTYHDGTWNGLGGIVRELIDIRSSGSEISITARGSDDNTWVRTMTEGWKLR